MQVLRKGDALIKKVESGNTVKLVRWNGGGPRADDGEEEDEE